MNIKDIARIAGVAVSTVSRVLNGHPDVASETREHILQLMQQHHYVPNNSARNLKLTHSKTIGVMVKGRDNPFFSKMIAVIEAALSDAGYSMLLHYHQHRTSTGTDPDDAASALGFVKEKRLCGLICLGGDYSESGLLALAESEVPLVLTSVECDPAGVPDSLSTVSIKNQDAAYEATMALLALGHRRIGLVSTGQEDQSAGRLRSEGYTQALLAYGIKPSPRLGVGANYTFESAYAAGRLLLTGDQRPTAIFATSDIMAIGVSKAAFDLGLRIPHDLSVMGFDGLDYGTYFHPTLATVAQPVEEMGAASARLILKRLEHSAPAEHITMKTEIWMRDSVGPAMDASASPYPVIEEENSEN